MSLTDANAIRTDKDLKIKVLDAANLGAWVNVVGYELHENIVQSVNQKQVTCIGAYIGSTLAGYCFFSKSPVNASQNSGGSRFNGIGLCFSNDVRYVYKVLVLPEFRRRNIGKQLIQYAATHFNQNSVTHFVTTTDWANAAFLQMAKSIGFTVPGLAGEFVLLGKHHYLIPSTIVLKPPGRGFVRLVKPLDSHS